MGAPTVTPLILRWTDTGGAERERELADGQLTIGRAPTSDLVVDDPLATRAHARLEVSGDSVVVHDLDSRNGTFVNAERVSTAELRAGDQLRIGGTVLQLLERGSDADQTVIAMSAEGTVVVDARRVSPDATHVLDAVAPPAPAPRQERGVVSDEMLARPVLSEAELTANGVEVQVTGCAALGAGLGSFMWVDLLRNSGVPADQITVIGVESKPHGRYERLCVNSQIPPHERLRSNSDSCPDNIWGFPSYATREIFRELGRGNLSLVGAIIWAIFGEPAISQTYTPRSGDVFHSIDSEMARIGWERMLRFGRIRAIRRSDTGRLIAIVSESDEQKRRHFAVSSRFMHLSVGYPAIQLLPDLAEYREKYRDRSRVVNAYEPHPHVYDQLVGQGGTVILRGRGIVASRIIQRIFEDRKRNPNINVIHLHRSKLTAGHRDGLASRQVDAEWEFQPFNWPKSCWTGEQRFRLERASPEQRKVLMDIWGGTTTADRRDWKRIVQQGLREGWYRPEYGVVSDVRQQDGKVVTRISNKLVGGGTLELPADFVIDCTGLIASPDRSPLVNDLITAHQLPLNPLGKLQVSNDFEVEAMRHGESRLYAAGASTLGGPFAAVDSFLGLQYAAYRAVHDMQEQAPRLIHSLRGLYSFGQWLKWTRHAAP